MDVFGHRPDLVWPNAEVMCPVNCKQLSKGMKDFPTVAGKLFLSVPTILHLRKSVKINSRHIVLFLVLKTRLA